MGKYLDKITDFAREAKKQGYHKVFADNAEHFVDTWAEELDAFPAYVNTVVRYSNTARLAGATLGTKEYQQRMTGIDRLRHDAHNTAIDAVNIINRGFGRLGPPPFADIDTSDRQAVADFAGNFTLEMYREEAGGGMAKAVETVNRRMDRPDPSRAEPTNISRVMRLAAEIEKNKDEAMSVLDAGLDH